MTIVYEQAVVDQDGNGEIDVDEFLAFLRPDHIPDVRAR
jgi:hypothetical protein